MLSGGRGILIRFRPVTNNPVFHFFHTPGNAGPLVLRMAAAGIFFFHGTQKALGWFGGPGWQGTIQTWTSATGLGLPDVIAPLVMVAELAICLALFFGLFTRLAGFAVVVIMSGALFIVSKHAPGIENLELPFLVWASGIALLCLGGGAFSIDRAISKNILPIVG